MNYTEVSPILIKRGQWRIQRGRAGSLGGSLNLIPLGGGSKAPSKVTAPPLLAGQLNGACSQVSMAGIAAVQTELGPALHPDMFQVNKLTTKYVVN